MTTPVLAPPPDTVAPTAPSGLTATAAPGAIDLSWTAGTDETALAGYRVFRDGTLVGTTYSTSYVDLGVSAGSHSYTVVAFDDGGNASPPAGPASTSAQPPLPASASYAYDAADRLISITTASGKATVFTIDVLGRHASTQTGTDPVSTYSYLGTTDTVVAVATSDATTSSAIDSLGDRVATSTSAGGFGYILADLHGNVAAAMGASATTISDAFAYDAWGNLVASVTSTLPTPWRYQGRILESAPGTSELYDFQARSYSPSIGAFTSLDSVAGSAQNPITLNRYLYAGANPATLIDPDGHKTCRYEGSQLVCTDASYNGSQLTQTQTSTWGTTTSTTQQTGNSATTTNTTRTAAGTTTNTVVGNTPRWQEHHCDNPVGCFAEGFLNAPGNAIRGAVKKVTDVISACGNLKPLECGEALVATQPIGMIVEYDASILAVDAAVVRGDWNSVACAAGGQTFWGAAAAVGVKVGGALKLGDAGVATGDGATGAAEEAGGAAESAGAAEVPAGEASGGGGGGGGIDEPYYHYTTSEGAAGIEASGQIVPGQEGLSWVSPTRYVDAATAQAELALPRTPSGYYQIPGSRISGLTRPSVVEADPPWPGGGIECTTTNSIDVGGLPFCVFP